MGSPKDEASAKLTRTPDRERRRWPREPQEEVVPLLPSVLQPLSFSTRDLAAEDQFAAWKAHLAPLVEVKLPDGTTLNDGFAADHTAWNLGGMLIVQQRAAPHSYARSAAKLRSSSIDHFYIVLPRAGRAWTEVNGRVTENQPGKVEFGSLGYPFRGRMTNPRA